MADKQSQNTFTIFLIISKIALVDITFVLL